MNDRSAETTRALADATLRVRFVLDSDLEGDLSEILNSHKTMGASLETRADRKVDVSVFFQSGDSGLIPDLVRALEKIGVRKTEIDSQEAEDWLASYRRHVRPFQVGASWWIDPHPEDPTPSPDGMRRLVIEPRMAFGTGSHQSTALVLMELENNPPAGLRVLDVGTGSGVLALASESLGASWAVGFDVDLEAVMVARQIVRDQEFPCSPSYFAGLLAAIRGGTFDLILCNMISEHFLPLAGSLRQLMSSRGAAIFSGILETEGDEVKAALVTAGYRVLATRALDGWVAFRASHAD